MVDNKSCRSRPSDPQIFRLDARPAEVAKKYHYAAASILAIASYGVVTCPNRKQTLLSICPPLNLECSADEILCKEINTARPIIDSWLTELVADCDQTEIKIIADTVATLKQALRKNKTTD